MKRYIDLEAHLDIVGERETGATVLASVLRGFPIAGWLLSISHQTDMQDEVDAPGRDAAALLRQAAGRRDAAEWNHGGPSPLTDAFAAFAYWSIDSQIIVADLRRPYFFCEADNGTSAYYRLADEEVPRFRAAVGERVWIDYFAHQVAAQRRK